MAAIGQYSRILLKGIGDLKPRAPSIKNGASVQNEHDNGKPSKTWDKSVYKNFYRSFTCCLIQEDGVSEDLLSTTFHRLT